jgi:ABC-type metal ion transport system substrate-binding protein
MPSSTCPFCRTRCASAATRSSPRQHLIAPIAFYSNKHKRLQDLPTKARVGIPNDPSNQTRALVILRDQGLIKLRDGFDPFSSTVGLADVTANPRQLQLVEAASTSWPARCPIWTPPPSSTPLPTRSA